MGRKLWQIIWPASALWTHENIRSHIWDIEWPQGVRHHGSLWKADTENRTNYCWSKETLAEWSGVSGHQCLFHLTSLTNTHPQILCGMCLQIKCCASVGLEKQQENPHYLWENCHKQSPWIKNKMKQTKKQLSLWNNLLQFNLLLLVIFMLIQAQSATLIACWICIQLFICAFVFRFRNDSYRWLLTL